MLHTILFIPRVGSPFLQIHDSDMITGHPLEKIIYGQVCINLFLILSFVFSVASKPKHKLYD